MSGLATDLPDVADHDGVEVGRAVEALRDGRLVAFPTETVYGLGADADNDDAVGRVFSLKGRPLGHPLIVHVGSLDHLDRYGESVSAAAWALATRFWPGPLTLLVPARPNVSRVATGGRDTVGIRMPAHPLTLHMLERFDRGVVGPSANRFGRVSPTTAAHVRDEFGDHVDMVLDGGPCRVGLESTIVDCCSARPQILRPGAITAPQVVDVIGALDNPAGPSRAPGMLDSHYAPACRLTLVSSPAEAAGVDAAEVLDFSGDSVAAAHELYARLRDLDRRGTDHAVVVLPRPDGIGLAVIDRLRKAAADRPPANVAASIGPAVALRQR